MGLLRSIAEALRRFAPPSSNSSSADPRHRLGAEGERVAARALKRDGFKILYRNFRAPGGGEVDIVCREGDVLVFAEVKTRSSAAHSAPSEAVTRKKQMLIIRGALAWLRMLGNPPIPIRFDIVEVLPGANGLTPRLIRDAFPLPERYRVSI